MSWKQRLKNERDADSMFELACKMIEGANLVGEAVEHYFDVLDNDGTNAPRLRNAIVYMRNTRDRLRKLQGGE